MFAQSVFLLGFSAIAIGSPPQVFLERGGGGVLDYSIIIRPEDFSRSQIERLSREFVEGHKGVNLLRFSIFTDKSDAGAALWGQHSHLGFEGWSEWLVKHTHFHPAMAETIVMNQSAIIRLRHADGRIERIKLTGEDPLRLQALGSTLEILYVAIQSVPPDALKGNEVTVDFLIKSTGPVSANFGRGLMCLLRKELPAQNIGIRIRNDSWFIGMGLPYVFPFDTKGAPPPRRDEYFRSLEIVCSSNRGEQGCTQLRP